MLYRKSFHVETTNRCTLQCPACPRTVWNQLVGRPVKKADLNLDDFKHFIDCKAGEKIEYFSLCGDYGDVIYYPDLFKMLRVFRNKGFRIHTNGSHKSVKWWQDLNSLLTTDDTVIFAIDGLGKDNEKYRINADWESITAGIDVLASGPAKLKCQTLIFDYNIDKLGQIQAWAENKGMEWFSLKTMRFGLDKGIVPKNKENTLTQELYMEEYEQKKPIEINPRCLEASIVTAEGYFMPCDWIRNPLTFYKSELYLNKIKWVDKLKISDITLDDAYGILDEWMQNVKQKGLAGEAEVLCKMKCRKC